MAKLTSARRKKLPSSDFAEPGKKKYPIEDKSHARNALARVSQHGTPEEKSEVRHKVHAKYPQIGKKPGKRGSQVHARTSAKKRIARKRA